jgi:hypothetical protein
MVKPRYGAGLARISMLADCCIASLSSFGGEGQGEEAVVLGL